MTTTVEEFPAIELEVVPDLTLHAAPAVSDLDTISTAETAVAGSDTHTPDEDEQSEHAPAASIPIKHSRFCRLSTCHAPPSTPNWLGVIAGTAGIGVAICFGILQLRVAQSDHELAAWEAQKDFRECCQLDELLNFTLSAACLQALRQPTQLLPGERLTKRALEKFGASRPDNILITLATTLYWTAASIAATLCVGVISVAAIAWYARVAARYVQNDHVRFTSVVRHDIWISWIETQKRRMLRVRHGPALVDLPWLEQPPIPGAWRDRDGHNTDEGASKPVRIGHEDEMLHEGGQNRWHPNIRIRKKYPRSHEQSSTKEQAQGDSEKHNAKLDNVHREQHRIDEHLTSAPPIPKLFERGVFRRPGQPKDTASVSEAAFERYIHNRTNASDRSPRSFADQQQDTRKQQIRPVRRLNKVEALKRIKRNGTKSRDFTVKVATSTLRRLKFKRELALQEDVVVSSDGNHRK